MTILSELASIPVRIAELVSAVNALRNTIASNPCGCPVGEGPDNEGGDGTTIPGQVSGGQEFQEAVIVDQQKCDRADYIYKSVNDSLVWLATYNVVDITTGTLSAIIALFAGYLALTGPFGAILIGVAGLVLAIALVLLDASLDLDDCVTVWQANQTDIICCLYNGESTDGIRTCIEAILTASVLDSLEVDFIMLFMPNGVLSLMFADTDQSAIFFDTYEGTIDCSPCLFVNPLEWQIAPMRMFFLGATDWGSDPMGTGTVLQDGQHFFIQSVPRPDNASIHIVGILINAYRDEVLGADPQLNNTPVQVGDSVVSQHNTGTYTLTRCKAANVPDNCASNLGGCSIPQNPGTINFPVALLWQRTGSFTMELSIDTPPSSCP